MNRVMAALALAGLTGCASVGGSGGSADRCPGGVQPGRWVKMADQPGAGLDSVGPPGRAGQRILTLTSYWPPAGFIYDACADRWRPMSTAGAPKETGARYWNGRELIAVPAGAAAFAYDLERDAWSPRGAIPRGWTAPPEQYRLETPYVLFVRGPMAKGDFGPGGFVWDTRTGTAAPIGGDALSMRATTSSAWVGERFATWGGVVEPHQPGPWLSVGDGGVLERKGDAWAWRKMTARGAPSPRAPETAAASGSRLVVWGGWTVVANKQECFTDGAAYDVEADSWRPIPSAGAPSPRQHSISVGTDRHFVVMGGDAACDAQRKSLPDGGVFDLEAGTWKSFTLPGWVAREYADVTALDDGRVLILPRVSNGLVGTWMAVLDPATAQVTRVELPRELQNRTGTQAVVMGRRLFLFGGNRPLPRPDCHGITPCDAAGPTSEATPGGMVYGL